MASTFAFTLCPSIDVMKQQHNKQSIIDINEYGNPKQYDISQFLSTLIYRPQLFNINLITLHQNRINKLNTIPIQRQLRIV